MKPSRSAPLLAALVAWVGCSGDEPVGEHGAQLQSVFVVVDGQMRADIHGGATYDPQQGNYAIGGATKSAFEDTAAGWCQVVPCLAADTSPQSPLFLTEEAFDVVADYAYQSDGSFLDPGSSDHVWLAPGWCDPFPCVEVVPY